MNTIQIFDKISSLQAQITELTRERDVLQELHTHCLGDNARLERERDELREANQGVHQSYLRLRSILPGALNTPYGPSVETVWQVTEDAAKVLLADRDALRERLAEAERALRTWDESVPWPWNDEDDPSAAYFAKHGA